jgi:hypothetical protein
LNGYGFRREGIFPFFPNLFPLWTYPPQYKARTGREMTEKGQVMAPGRVGGLKNRELLKEECEKND